MSESAPLPVAIQAPADAGHIAPLDILLLLAKRKGFIVRITLISALLGGIVASIMKPYFTATALIMPPEQTQSTAAALMGQLGSLASLGGGSSLGLKSPADMYLGILQSRTIADDIIDKFHLITLYKTKTRSDARIMLSKHEKFTAGKDGLISIEVDDPNATRAAEIANGFVDSLYAVNSKLATTEAGHRRLFFDREMEQEKQALSAAEANFVAAQKQSGIIALSGQTETIIRNIADVRAEISSGEVELQEVRSYATEENPQTVVLQNELSALRSELTKLESQQAESQPGNLQFSSGKVPQAGLEYERKLREVQYHQALVLLLSRQYEVARIDEAKSAPTIQVIDRAVTPDKKSGPHRLLIAIGCGMFGFLIACVASFISESLNFMRTRPESASKLNQLSSALKIRSS